MEGVALTLTVPRTLALVPRATCKELLKLTPLHVLIQPRSAGPTAQPSTITVRRPTLAPTVARAQRFLTPTHARVPLVTGVLPHFDFFARLSRAVSWGVAEPTAIR
jgi:hypothetical protein